MNSIEKAKRFTKVARKKFVKVNKDRGYGDKPYEVLATSLYEYRLISTDETRKQPFNLYKAHCYEDLETKRLSFKKD